MNKDQKTKSGFDNQKLINALLQFVNMKGIIALKEGMLSILPLTVAGSIFLVIGQIPSESINNAIAGVFGQNWTEPFMQVHAGTFAIMALVVAFSIAYCYAKNDDTEPMPAGILSVAAFFITLRSHIVLDNGVKADALARVWFGGQGIVGAIIIGLCVGAIYSTMINKGMTIRLPESVPQGVAKQFAALIPAIVIFFLAMMVYILFQVTRGETFIEFIYQVIQVPMQGLTDSLGGVIGIAVCISLLWWFGVHGQSVVNGVVTSLLTANAVANTEALKQTGKLIAGVNAHIVTQQFLDSFLIISGSGITFGLVVAMLIASKSEQYKTLGKLALFPSIFNINEPVVFGFPIVMNPLMFIPFILVPVASAILVYASIAIGFVSPFSGIMLPWSTPMLISGLLVAGWQGLVMQILIFIISIVGYYPFFKKQDQIAYEEELALKSILKEQDSRV